MAHPYRVTVTKRAPKGEIVKADLTENGIVIGIVTKSGGPYRFAVRFLSAQARSRFESFADSLSVGEAIEAII